DGPGRVVVTAAVGAEGVEAGDAVRRSRAHDHLNVYTGLPNYRNSWTRHGFAESDYVRGGSERLKRALVSQGMEATRQRVQEHLDAGASTVLVQVLCDVIMTPPLEYRRSVSLLLLYGRRCVYRTITAPQDITSV